MVKVIDLAKFLHKSIERMLLKNQLVEDRTISRPAQNERRLGPKGKTQKQRSP